METRHWDEGAGVTRGGRIKEGSSDYRYFPDPDLVPMELDRRWEEEMAALLPELPAQRRSRFQAMGIDPAQAATLAGADPHLRGLFGEAVEAGADPVQAANWVTGEVVATLRRSGRSSLEGSPLTGSDLARLLAMIGGATLSGSAAREVLAGVMEGEGSPEEVATTAGSPPDLGYERAGVGGRSRDRRPSAGVRPPPEGRAQADRLLS